MASIDWIILVTDRYTESRTFYTDILGLPVVREVRDEEFIQMKLDNTYLALYGRQAFEKLTDAPAAIGGSILTISLGGTVKDTYRRLKDKGVPFIREPEVQSWGQRTAYFTDPDGHIWEIEEWIN